MILRKIVILGSVSERPKKVLRNICTAPRTNFFIALCGTWYLQSPVRLAFPFLTTAIQRKFGSVIQHFLLIFCFVTLMC